MGLLRQQPTKQCSGGWRRYNKWKWNSYTGGYNRRSRPLHARRRLGNHSRHSGGAYLQWCRRCNYNSQQCWERKHVRWCTFLNLNSIGTVALTPGTFSGINVAGNSTLTFASGTYCITGNLGLNSNDVVNGTAGTVNLVMGNNNLQFGSNTVDTFSDLEIWANNGGFDVSNNAVLKATSKFRFYSTGSSTFMIDFKQRHQRPQRFHLFDQRCPNFELQFRYHTGSSVQPRSVCRTGDLHALEYQHIHINDR